MKLTAKERKEFIKLFNRLAKYYSDKEDFSLAMDRMHIDDIRECEKELQTRHILIGEDIVQVLGLSKKEEKELSL